MISKESQKVMDYMVAGYVGLMTGLSAEVTEPGNVWVDKKFANTHNLNIDTSREGSNLVLLITDDDDPSTVVEEIYDDLTEVAERIEEINTLSEED